MACDMVNAPAAAALALGAQHGVQRVLPTLLDHLVGLTKLERCHQDVVQGGSGLLSHLPETGQRLDFAGRW